jgi:SAM-dependent methyltransferase
MNHKPVDRTIRYYNENADEFIKATIDSDMRYYYEFFLKYVKSGQIILDLGCGSGRDSKYFIEHGFEVVAIDGSEAICRQASKYLGQKVICRCFEDIQYEDKFDGIWACASLLHVKRTELPNIINNLSNALKMNGYLYASFKYGNEERVLGERYFNDYTEKDIDKLFYENNGFKCIEWNVLEDVRSNREGERWLNVIAKKI